MRGVVHCAGLPARWRSVIWGSGEEQSAEGQGTDAGSRRGARRSRASDQAGARVTEEAQRGGGRADGQPDDEAAARAGTRARNAAREAGDSQGWRGREGQPSAGEERNVGRGVLQADGRRAGRETERVRGVLAAGGGVESSVQGSERAAKVRCAGPCSCIAGAAAAR